MNFDTNNQSAFFGTYLLGIASALFIALIVFGFVSVPITAVFWVTIVGAAFYIAGIIVLATNMKSVKDKSAPMSPASKAISELFVLSVILLALGTVISNLSM